MTSDYLGREYSSLHTSTTYVAADPITSIQPTKDNQTLLITTLDAKIRLLDRKTGQCLNTFEGHKHESYRCKATFNALEDCVIFGDEDGRVWAWDLVNVSYNITESEFLASNDISSISPWSSYSPKRINLPLSGVLILPSRIGNPPLTQSTASGA
jgi:WD40 repeat protein